MTAIRFEVANRSFGEFRRPSARQVLGHAAAGLRAKFREWRRRAGDRSELARLDDRMLADIGISRAEAEFLSSKPFWRE
jgi:uncharacterized protein YjiS (DUF1127 family)